MGDTDRSATEQAGVGEAAGRRGLLRSGSTLLMFGGLAAAYGTFAGFLGRFLYPSGPAETAWLFVSDVGGFLAGEALGYRLPNGARVTIARQGSGAEAEDFIALSSTCPHLGCQVHWEGQNDRFFCPCHNGVFDPKGTAVAGPPAEAGQSLPRYPLKVDGGLLYIQVPVEVAAAGELRRADPPAQRGPGHDPCLSSDGREPERRA